LATVVRSVFASSQLLPDQERQEKACIASVE
jgi:hypothetical protein